MPFQSEAQRAKFARMRKAGEIDEETWDRWNEETKGKLPARLHAKKTKAQKKRPSKGRRRQPW